MKNSQTGFVLPITIASVILLVLGGGAYFYLDNTVEGPKLEEEINQTCVSQADGEPVITSLSTSTGPIGTILEVRGCNLSGFEGDLDLIFERKDGKKIILTDTFSSYLITADTLIKVVIDEPCEQGEMVIGRYSGISAVCDYVELIPGVYDVYTEPWGKKSNIFNFNLIAKSAEEKPLEFFFAPGNFMLTLPAGWSTYNVSQNDLPIDLMDKENVSFSFIKDKTSCVLTYGLSSQNSYGKYSQTSFGQRVFTVNGDQIDSSWYVHDLFRPSGLGFSWTGEKPTAQEVRIMHYPFSQGRTGDFYYKFILYNKDGAEVDRQCDIEVSKILSSIEKKFNPVTNIDDGIIYITDIYNATDTVVFIPNGKTEGFSFVKFESKLGRIPFLFDNNLYFVIDGKMHHFNILSGVSGYLSGIDYSKGVVNGFSIIGSDLFFFFGESCSFYMGKCNNDLYRYNIVEKDLVKLVSETKSNIILGTDENKNYLYISRSFGDAGCFSISTESYNFITKELKKENDYGGCDGEMGYAESSKKYQDFVSALKPVIHNTDYLIIKDKQIYLPTKPLDTVNRRMVFRYILD